MLPNLTIDSRRLWEMLMETARIGGTPKGGIRRLTLSDEDRRVRDWFRAECEALGCTVHVDTAGNMIAIRPGKDNARKPIAMGSHLDTQPTGGKFDGVLGVLAGLEAMKTLHQAGYETQSPIALINWTNEEGARFSPSMVGSAVYAGALTQAQMDACKDRDGVTQGEALDAIGYRGTVAPGAIGFAAYFELHIEQGPVLEEEGRTIGIVNGVQAIKWFTGQITGRESHAGTTPMTYRRDALSAFAEAVVAMRQIALDHAPGMATVGIVSAEPGSPNIVPGTVKFTLDTRHPSNEVLGEMVAKIRTAFEEAATRHKGVADIQPLQDSPAQPFDATCVAMVRQAAEKIGVSARELTSGAGHDAMYTARVCPSAMIFVPCAEGLSHNETESATQDDCAAGAQVLLEAVLAYDARG
ncbi:M20 family metallo-hydrolase [Phreatobacter sp.]|uniref:M20 family metallo-hydrolase n=1 Tax=Phreatobacter sp. TaxID=1966341 RepID=UPI003F721A50